MNASLRLAVLLSLLGATAQAQAQAQAQTPARPDRARAAAGLGMAALPIQAAALTLPQAEQLLVERNLGVLAARRGIDLARAQRLVAGSRPPATLSGSMVVGQTNETQNYALYGTRGFFPDNNLNLGLSVTIERGGRRELRSRVADENISVAEAQVLDALRTQIFVLRQNFIAALLARANLEVALANRASLDRTEALLRRQFQSGSAPEGDLLRFQASRLAFEPDVTNSAQAYAAAVAAVAVALGGDAAAFAGGAGTPGSLGLPNPAPVTPARPRGQPDGDAVRTILSPVAFDLRGRFDQVPTLGGLSRDVLAAAVTERPDVVAALRQANAADANTRLAESQRSQDITLNAGVGRTRISQNIPSAPDQTLRANTQATIGLSIPIFTSRIVEGNISAAQAQAGQTQAQAQGTLLQARADFATAWATYEQSRALLALYTGGALARAQEAYQSTNAAYQAGGRTLLDVLDALRTLNTTRVAANAARAAYLTALAQLEQATGVSGLAPRL